MTVEECNNSTESTSCYYGFLATVVSIDNKSKGKKYGITILRFTSAKEGNNKAETSHGNDSSFSGVISNANETNNLTCIMADFIRCRVCTECTNNWTKSTRGDNGVNEGVFNTTIVIKNLKCTRADRFTLRTLRG